MIQWHVFISVAKHYNPYSVNFASLLTALPQTIIPIQLTLLACIIAHMSHHRVFQKLFFSQQCYQTCDLRARLGYFWLPRRGKQSLTATLLLLTSWPRNVLKSGALRKIVNFLSIQGDFEPFQCQWADLFSIDRIKTSYGAIESDYPQLPELDNLSFFRLIGWFLVKLPQKTPKIRHLGVFLLDKKLGYF